MHGSSLRTLVTLVIAFLPLMLNALHEGQSKEEVRTELGSPNGMRTLANGEIWVYSGDITLEFSGDRLVRAKGLALSPAPEGTYSEAEESIAGEDLVVPDPDPEPPGPGESPEADAISDEDALDAAEKGGGALGDALAYVVPVFLQFIFLIIAFRIVGAEASKMALLFIAVADRFVTMGVRWFFLGLLEFPTTFHADTLASFIVMLMMVTTLTHAKRLPTAIKVVIISKVAGLVAAYFVFLFILHNL